MADGDRVTLREITKDTVRTITSLRVRPDQEKFVSANAISIAEAYFHRETAWFRAIYAGETPVGFVMLEDNALKQDYFLWRFMIDGRYQRHGYGRQALELVVEYVKTRPGARRLDLSFVPGDGSPRPFYESFGFVATGELEEGEELMRLDLGTYLPRGRS